MGDPVSALLVEEILMAMLEVAVGTVSVMLAPVGIAYTSLQLFEQPCKKHVLDSILWSPDLDRCLEDMYYTQALETAWRSL